MIKKIKFKKGYGAFEYVVVAAFILAIALFVLTDTKGAISTSSSVMRTSFLEMFGVTPTP